MQGIVLDAGHTSAYKHVYKRVWDIHGVQNTEETPLILSRRINEGFFEKTKPRKEP